MAKIEALIPLEYQPLIRELLQKIRSIRSKNLRTSAWFYRILSDELKKGGLSDSQWTSLVESFAGNRLSRKRVRPVCKNIVESLEQELERLQITGREPCDRENKVEKRRLQMPGAITVRGGQTRKPGSHRSN